MKTESIYLIQLKGKPRKGKPGGDLHWQIDFDSKPIEKIREANQKAIDLSNEFPHVDFRAKLYWENEE